MTLHGYINSIIIPYEIEGKITPKITIIGKRPLFADIGDSADSIFMNDNSIYKAAHLIFRKNILNNIALVNLLSIILDI